MTTTTEPGADATQSDELVMDTHRLLKSWIAEANRRMKAPELIDARIFNRIGELVLAAMDWQYQLAKDKAARAEAKAAADAVARRRATLGIRS